MKRAVAIARILAVLACAVAFVRSYALAVPPVDGDAPVSLAVEFKMGDVVIPGAKTDLYLVGTIDSGGGVELLPEYAGTYDATEATSRKGWARLARQMASDFQNNGTEVLESVTTDDAGYADFGAQAPLEHGLYLVVVHDTKVGKETYCALPYLVSLPMWDVESQSWDYDVLSRPKVDKYTEEEPPSPTPVPKEKTKKTIWDHLPKTGEEAAVWLSYAVIGATLVVVSRRLRHPEEESQEEAE